MFDVSYGYRAGCRHLERRWRRRFAAPPHSWRPLGPMTLERHRRSVLLANSLNGLLKEIYGSHMTELVPTFSFIQWVPL